MSRLYSAVHDERRATLAAIDVKIENCERTRADAERRDKRDLAYAMTTTLCVLRSLRLAITTREIPCSTATTST